MANSKVRKYALTGFPQGEMDRSALQAALKERPPQGDWQSLHQVPTFEVISIRRNNDTSALAINKEEIGPVNFTQNLVLEGGYGQPKS